MSDRDLILAGKHLLVVDDEPMLAYDLADTLTGHGASIAGLHQDIFDAMRTVSSAPKIDCALLDIQVGDHLVWPLARELQQRGIPFVFVSARCGVDKLPDEFSNVACLSKPFDTHKLRQALTSILFV